MITMTPRMRQDAVTREHCRKNFEQPATLASFNHHGSLVSIVDKYPDGRVVKVYDRVADRPSEPKTQNDHTKRLENQEYWKPSGPKPHPCDVIQRLSLAYAAEGLDTVERDAPERSWDPWEAMDRLFDWRPGYPWYTYVLYPLVALHSILLIIRVILLCLS